MRNLDDAPVLLHTGALHQEGLALDVREPATEKHLVLGEPHHAGFNWLEVFDRMLGTGNKARASEKKHHAVVWSSPPALADTCHSLAL